MALNITKEVATMERLSVGALCERYRDVFGEDTKARNKQWLIKRIAWKLQANEEGDISERARKHAMEIAQSSDIRTSAPKIRTHPVEVTFATATTIITPPAVARLADLQERVQHNERRMIVVDKELAEIDASTHNRVEIESSLLSFDPIWEAMTLRDQIRLIQLVVKRVDYDGETGRVTITFHPLGGKSQSEYAAKDLSQV